ncbi:hypothetical protein As57867_002464, partial [Aphanomyces stellatus]
SMLRSLSVAADIFEQYDRLHALLALVDVVATYVQVRADAIDHAPLARLALAPLLDHVKNLRRQAQPHCAVLGGVDHPLVGQFLPNADRLCEALEAGIAMAHIRFTPARWLRLEAFLPHAAAAGACTIPHVEAALALPTARQLMKELTDATRAEARIQATIAATKDALAALAFECVADGHVVHVINCVALVESLEDVKLGLLPIRHRQNPWLADVQRLERRVQDAMALVTSIHEMETSWSELAVVLALPELKTFEKDTVLWQRLAEMDETWRDGLLALYHWNSSNSNSCGPSNSCGASNSGSNNCATLLAQLDAIFQPMDFVQFHLECDRLRASMHEYMETLRIGFPRLYFLSNADMFALFNSSNPVNAAVQQCYRGILHTDTTAAAASTSSSASLIVTTPPHACTTLHAAGGKIEGLMDSDFMGWLLGGHAVSFVHAVVFRGSTAAGWRLPLFRPVKILGSLAFWLGQFDTILRHSLGTNLADMKATFVYDPATVDQVMTWHATLPPQLRLGLMHVRFCTLVGRLVASKTASATQLQATVATYDAYRAKLVMAVRQAKTRIHAVEDAILLVTFELETLRLLAARAATHDWRDVIQAWTESFRLEDDDDGGMASTAKATGATPSSGPPRLVRAAMGHVSVAGGLEMQPMMPWIAILPATQRCLFALTHALHLHATCSVMATGDARTGKRTLLRAVGYVLLQSQWELPCHADTSPAHVLSFVTGVAALRGWACIHHAFDQLPRAVLGVLVTEIHRLHQVAVASSSSSACGGGSFFCLPYHGTCVDASLARWLGQPLRPIAFCPPDRTRLVHVLFAANGFADTEAIDVVDRVLQILCASVPRAAAACSFRLVQRLASTAWSITKEVSYIIHGHGTGGAGAHLRHDVSPLNVARYKDANVFRFALLLVLDSVVPQALLHAVVDEVVPTTTELRQESRMFASAFTVVLERAHHVVTPSLVQKGVDLRNMLQSGATALLVGGAATGKTTCLKTTLRAIQLVDSILRTDLQGHLERPTQVSLTFVTMDELGPTPETAAMLTRALAPAKPTKISCVCLDGALPPASSSVSDCIESIVARRPAVWLPSGHSIPRPADAPVVVLETASVASLAPALLAHCNVLCMQPSSSGDGGGLTWQVLLQGWVARPRDPLVSELTHTAVERSVLELALPFLATQPTATGPPVAVLMDQSLRLISAIHASLPPSPATHLVDQVAFLAVVWGFGAHLEPAARARFLGFVTHAIETMRWQSIEPVIGLCTAHDASLFDLAVDFAEHRVVVVVATTSIADSSWSGALVVVPTPPMRFATTMLSLLHSTGHSLLLVGDRGTGKSTTLAHLARLFVMPTTDGTTDTGEASSTTTTAAGLFLHTPSNSKHAALRRWLLQTHATEKRHLAFVDDVAATAPTNDLQLCRDATNHKRLFHSARLGSVAVHASLCLAIDARQLETAVPLDANRHRLVRPFFALHATELTDTELEALFCLVSERRLARRLNATERWFVAATVALVRLVRRSLDRQLPQYRFGNGVIDQVVAATLTHDRSSGGTTGLLFSTHWLLQVKSAMWDALACDAHRVDMCKAIQRVAEDGFFSVDVAEMDRLDWKRPGVAAVMPPTATGHLFHALREYIVTSYEQMPSTHSKIDLMWLRAMNSNLVVHWIQIKDAVESATHMIVVGHERQSHDNVVKLVAHVTRATYLSFQDATSSEVVSQRLDALVSVDETKKSLVSIYDEDLDRWPHLWAFVLDFFRGHHTAAAVRHVVDRSGYVPATLDQPGVLDHFMHYVVRANVSLCVYFDHMASAETRAKLEMLVADRAVPTTVLTAPSFRDRQLYETALGYLTQLVGRHPQLEIPLTECPTLARACTDIHASVAATVGLFNLLNTFKHLVELRAGVTTDAHVDRVTTAIRLVDELRASYVAAQAQAIRWDAAYENCRARHVALKKQTAAVETSLTATAKSMRELDVQLEQLERQRAEGSAAIDAQERQLRIEKKALDHLVLQPLAATEKQHMLGEFKSFLPLVRMATAVNLLFEATPSTTELSPTTAMETAGAIMEAHDFPQKLVHMKLPAAARHAFETSVSFAPADVALLHTKHPVFAAIVRWLLFKLSQVVAAEAMSMLHASVHAADDAVALAHTQLEALEGTTRALHVSLDVARGLREELSMETAETKAATMRAKREAARLSPLQPVVDRYSTWLRATFFVPMPSTPGQLLFLAAVVAYTGASATTKQRHDLTRLWSTILAEHGYVLPLELDVIADSTVSLLSTLQGNICFGQTVSDKTMRHGLAVADWSHQTPLFLDPCGLAELRLVQFFKRMQLALGNDIGHVVLSCDDPSLINKLHDAVVQGHLVVLTNFSAARWDVLRPFLLHPRMPLVLELHVRHAAAHGHAPTTASVARKATGASAAHGLTRHRTYHDDRRHHAASSASTPKGNFQLYLVARGTCPPLDSHQRSLVNVIDCSAPWREVHALVETQLRGVVGLAHTAHHDCLQLTNLQTYVEQHALHARLLSEILATPTHDHAVHAILKFDRLHRPLEAKLAVESDAPPLRASPALVEATEAAAALLADILHALWHVEPLASHGRSLTHVHHLVAAMAEDYIHHHAIISDADKVKMIQCLVQQLYATTALGLPVACHRLFPVVLAILRTPGAPPVARVLHFLGASGDDHTSDTPASTSVHDNSVQSPDANTVPRRISLPKTLSSVVTSHSHVHRVRRINSALPTAGVVSLVNDDNATTLPEIPHHPVFAAWHSTGMFAQLRLLERLQPDCVGVVRHIRQHAAAWLANIKQALGASPPHFVVPHSWPSPLSALSRALLVKCICPDILAFHMDLFATETLPELLDRDPLPLYLSQCVLIVVDSDAVPPRVDALGLDLTQRLVVHDKCDDAVDASVAKGGSVVVVELLDSAGFPSLDDAIARRGAGHPRKKTPCGHIYLVCMREVVDSLPEAFVHETQTIVLPLAVPHLLPPHCTPPSSLGLPTSSSVVASPTRDSHLHGSVVGRLARNLRDLKQHMRVWSTCHAIGWRQFVAREFHAIDATAMLRFFGDLEARCPGDAATLLEAACVALEMGVFGAEMHDDYDRTRLHRVVQDVLANDGGLRQGTSHLSSIASLGSSRAADTWSDYALTERFAACGVSARVALYLRNTALLHTSAQLVAHCRAVALVGTTDRDNDNDTVRHVLAVHLLVFQAFLRVHHAYDGSTSSSAASGSDPSASSAAMVTVAALKFRRSIKRIAGQHKTAPAPTAVAALMLDDLVGRCALLLRCTARLDALLHLQTAEGATTHRHTAMHDDEEMALLRQYVIPPSWLGLPPSASSPSLQAFAAHLDACNVFFSQLKYTVQTCGATGVVELDCLDAPRALFAKLQLQYARAVGCDIDLLVLHLDVAPKEQPHGVHAAHGAVVHDAASHVCGVVASGLWLFHDDGNNQPLFRRLPPVRLYFSLRELELPPPTTHLLVPWFSLWSLKHVGERPMGDSRVFTSLGELHVAADVLPTRQGLATTTAPIVLCPKVDDQPNAVALLDVQRASSSPSSSSSSSSLQS